MGTIDVFMGWFRPVKVHVSVMRSYDFANNQSRNYYDGYYVKMSNIVASTLLKPKAAVVHVVSEKGSVYGLLGIDKYSFMELFDGLIRVRELGGKEREEWVPETVFCTEQQDLPTFVRAPRVHRYCKLVVIVATPVIRKTLSFFNTRLIARVYASCQDPLRALNIIAQYTYVKTPLKKYDLEDALKEILNAEEYSLVNTLEALRTPLKPVKPDDVVITPLEVNTRPIEGTIRLGEILDPLLEPIGEEYKLPLGHGHTLIAGATGTGKSTTLAKLAQEESRHVKTIILDWTGEHTETLGQSPQAEVIEPGETHSIPLRTPWDTIADVVEKIAY